uniref:Uncharacterized protein n=1 Tax=Ditylenchus dipsaci TaxID=166011 RepID=A0A915CP86_9BILA
MMRNIYQQFAAAALANASLPPTSTVSLSQTPLSRHQTTYPVSASTFAPDYTIASSKLILCGFTAYESRMARTAIKWTWSGFPRFPMSH